MQHRKFTEIKNPIIIYPLIISALAAFAIYLGFSTNYFLGDDFELLVQAINGVSLFKPVSVHIRPVLRLHFQLVKIFGSNPFLFHLLSLFLHMVASISLYIFLKDLYSQTTALISSLFFFLIFRANEVVFWISAAGILYCFIFSFLSMHFYLRRKVWLSGIFLILALFSYELWVVIPVVFLIFRKDRLLLYSSFMLGVLFFILEYFKLGPFLGKYGGFSLKQLPFRMTVYIWKTVSPFGGLPPEPIFFFMFIALLGVLVYFITKKDIKLILPLAIYLTSSFILSFSSIIPSRFYYFPVGAMVIFLALGLESSLKEIRVISVFLAGYFLVISPVILYLDGKDYRNFSTMHLKLMLTTEQLLEGAVPGDRVEYKIGKLPDFTRLYLSSIKGTAKIVFVRKRALGRLIYPEDLITLSLWKRGLRPQFAPCNHFYPSIDVIIGEPPPVHRICFTVSKR